MNIYSAYEEEINKYYQVVDVTEAGISYVLKSLRYGRMLSNLTARYLPIEKGKVKTFAHHSVEITDLSQFETTWIGRDLPESIRNFPEDDSKRGIDPEMNFFVVPAIQDFLAERNQNICIHEHIDARPTPQRMKHYADYPVLTFADQDVYFFIDDAEATIASIRQPFGTIPSWNAKAFLTSLPDNAEPLRKHQEIDLNLLKLMAKRTEKIIVGAYDGEGYLIWSRSQSAG